VSLSVPGGKVILTLQPDGGGWRFLLKPRGLEEERLTFVLDEQRSPLRVPRWLVPDVEEAARMYSAPAPVWGPSTHPQGAGADMSLSVLPCAFDSHAVSMS